MAQKGQTLPPSSSSTTTRRPSRLSITSANKAIGIPDMLKSAPLSAVLTSNYDPRDSRSTPATLSLRGVLGHLTGEEQQRSRSVAQLHTTQASVHERPASPASTARSRHTFHHSPSRSLRRSPSTESLATASSSEAPATPREHSPLLTTLNAPLEDLERTSRFRIRAVCAVCKKKGSNFPSCAKCGEAWCSRDCRTKGSSTGRHVCHGSRV